MSSLLPYVEVRGVYVDRKNVMPASMFLDLACSTARGNPGKSSNKPQNTSRKAADVLHFAELTLEHTHTFPHTRQSPDRTASNELTTASECMHNILQPLNTTHISFAPSKRPRHSRKLLERG